MSFTWPLALLLLLVVPALLAAYLLQLRRRRRMAVRYSSVALVRAAAPTRSRWRRLVPTALFLAALCGLAVASARPQASMTVPLGRTSIILALDVSRSMCATDVEPNRLAVAQDAARAFIDDQPSGTRIGLVAFAGFAELLVAPTTEKQSLLAAVDGLTTGRGTAIGAATLKSVNAIAAVNPDVAPVDVYFGNDGTPGGPGLPSEDDGYVPDIVVLLTDGANTQGIEPMAAAEMARERRVRVYTIGFGTTDPTELVCTAEQLGSDVFGDGFFGGGGGGGGGFRGAPRQFLVIDEPTLRAVAEMTAGAYFRAENADQLRQVFTDLPKQVELQRRDVELSALFAGVGALLAAAAMGLSLLWNRSP